MGILTGKGLISKQSAQWQIERFAWLIETFCPQYGPLKSSFQTIENNDFSLMPPRPEPGDSDALIQAWAQSYLDVVKSRIGMTNWPLQLVLRDKDLPKREADKELHLMAHFDGPERYYTDTFGRPVIYAEPKRLDEPGYLMTRITLAISDLMHVSATKPENISKDSHSALTDLTAAFLGIGIVPVHVHSHICPEPSSNRNLLDSFNRQAGAENIFACALFLSVKGYQSGQALAIHGKAFSKQARMQLELAFKQLSGFKTDVARLRALAISADTDADSHLAVSPASQSKMA